MPTQKSNSKKYEPDLIFKLTGYLSPSERSKIRHWIAAMPEDAYISIHQKAEKKYYQLKDGNPEVAGRLLRYAALILAAREAGWNTSRGKGYRVAGQKQYEDWKDIRKIRAANLAKDNVGPKKRAVIAYWGEIKELKEDALGFRRIARYLGKYRKLKVSPSYLQQLWAEIETQKKKEQL